MAFVRRIPGCGTISGSRTLGASSPVMTAHPMLIRLLSSLTMLVNNLSGNDLKIMQAIGKHEIIVSIENWYGLVKPIRDCRVEPALSSYPLGPLFTANLPTATVARFPYCCTWFCQISRYILAWFLQIYLFLWHSGVNTVSLHHKYMLMSLDVGEGYHMENAYFQSHQNGFFGFFFCLFYHYVISAVKASVPTSVNGVVLWLRITGS